MCPKSPLSENTDLVSINIKVSGSVIPDAYGILSISVVKKINKIATATIKLKDGDVASANFPISDSDTFIPGIEIEIEAGYHSENVVIFKGVITAQSIKIDSREGSILIIDCTDKAFLLNKGRKNRSFENVKDSEAISSILSEYSLVSSVEDTETEHANLVQYYSTDWDYILKRAEVNGQVIIVNDGVIKVKQPEPQKAPVLTVAYGDSIVEFNSKLDGQFQFDNIKSNSWDHSIQEINSATSTEPIVNDQGNISGKDLSNDLNINSELLQTSTPETVNNLKNWANASLMKARLSRIQGSVSFQGNATPLPDETIEIKGVGKRFDGNAYISAVQHTIKRGNWLTNVTFGLDSNWNIETTNAIAHQSDSLIPSIQGIHIGKVLKIDEDETGEFKVLIQLPLMGSETKVWARLNNIYASKGFGVFFYPEINDEVSIAFLNNDPRFPIILGSIYSSQLNPAEVPDEYNSIKSIVTSSKLKLSFNDQKKEIQIETPAGNSFSISEEDENIILNDQNGNSIKMSSDGIEIDSAKDLLISAKGDVKIDGVNITNTAKADFSAEGNTSAELSSSASTTVKGAMVMIN